MKINLLSISDKNGLNFVYILLNSLKKTKQQQTEVVYHLIVEDLDQSVKQYFADLQSTDFRIEYTDIAPFREKIHLPQKGFATRANYYTMVRCLCPAYFTELNKVLYLDTDIVFLQGGVEQLWNIDVDDYYLAGVEDIMVQKFNKMQFERDNTKNSTTYINAGVALYNYKLIRQAGLDQQLVKWCEHWNEDQLKPHYLDQSLQNYLFREKIKLIDFKYNNYSLVLSSTVLGFVKEHLKQLYNYDEPVNSVKDAVILHFLGDLKPWGKDFYRLRSYCPYSAALVKIWQNISKQLGKK